MNQQDDDDDWSVYDVPVLRGRERELLLMLKGELKRLKCLADAVYDATGEEETNEDARVNRELVAGALCGILSSAVDDIEFIESNPTNVLQF